VINCGIDHADRADRAPVGHGSYTGRAQRQELIGPSSVLMRLSR
jgi:hypothetical protein